MKTLWAETGERVVRADFEWGAGDICGLWPQAWFYTARPVLVGNAARSTGRAVSPGRRPHFQLPFPEIAAWPSR
jgi:hypothetical protein